MCLQPPFTKEWSNEWRNETTDINEYIENLETRVTLLFGFCKSFWTFLSSCFLKLIVHLADNCLKIAFEQTIAECNA